MNFGEVNYMLNIRGKGLDYLKNTAGFGLDIKPVEEAISDGPFAKIDFIHENSVL
jgi:hypothetical protein